MLKQYSFALKFLIAVIFPGAGMVSAQSYPTKPIRLITAEPGSGIDFTARLLAQGLTNSLGQPVVIENRPTIISLEAGSKAQPDGYTLITAGNSMWNLPDMQSNTKWDPVKDFAPISLVTSSPLILTIRPSLPVKSVKELIDLARAKPGELNYASGAAGALPHLAGELLKSMAKINIVLIPYKGTGAAVIDMIAGRVDMIIPGAGAVAPHIKSGKLRALAVTTAKPSALFPDLPTVASAGLSGYEVMQMIGLFAGGNTPKPIIDRLYQETVRFITTPDAKERLMNNGGEVIASSPAQLSAILKSDMVRMRKVIKDTGIKAE